MIQSKTETEDLLLSITKNCEKWIGQTQRKAGEVVELKVIKRRETFLFKPPIQIKGDWMIGLRSLEVYNSFFIINQENNKLESYTDTFDKFSFLELKDELEEILDISNTTDEHLRDEIIVPLIIKAF